MTPTVSYKKIANILRTGKYFNMYSAKFELSFLKLHYMYRIMWSGNYHFSKP